MIHTMTIRELIARINVLGEFSALLKDGRMITSFDRDTLWLDGISFRMTDEWLGRKALVITIPN